MEGEEIEVDEYVGRVRQLRWQAMEVRYAVCEPWPTQGAEAADEGALPSPFVELPESAMGTAAALCDAAGLLAVFRTTVLLGATRARRLPHC